LADAEPLLVGGGRPSHAVVPVTTTEHFGVPPALSQELVALARRLGMPLRALLLAAHLKIMSFVSGRTDIITGVVTHGRPETEEGERTLGMFLNTLPLRARPGHGSWLSLVQLAYELERRQCRT